MTIEQFIQENRELIDAYVKANTHRAELLNDDERRLVVLNTQELFKKAISAGVVVI